MELHDFQSEGMAEVRAHMQRGQRRVLYQLATGGGKSYCAADTIKRAVAKGKRVVFQVHRGIILEQQARTLDEWGIKYGWIAAGKPASDNQVLLGSIPTIVRRLDSIDAPDLVITDEAHHASAATTKTILDRWDKAASIGFSATPKRLDGLSLSNYDAMVCGPSMRWLIENGYLANYRLITVPNDLDMSGVHKTRGGDYNQQEVAAAFGGSTIFGDSVAEYRKHAHGKQCLVFAPSIQYAEEVSQLYRDAGYSAAVIHGKQAPLVIRETTAAFKAGLITVMVSVDLVGEGYSVDGVEVVSVLRKTASVARWLQWCGRALRVKPGGATALILDHGGNYLEHDAPCAEREWSLEGRKKGKRETSGEAAPTYCPAHFTACRRPDMPCTEPLLDGSPCGWLPPVQEREIEQVEGDLVEVDVLAERRERKAQEAQAETLEDLIALGKERGYKNGWARHRFQARQRKQQRVG